MAGEFWIDGQQRAVIAPLLPTKNPALIKPTIAGSSAGSSMFCALAAVGRIARPVTVLRQLFTIVSTVGLPKGFGGGCLKPWCKRPIATFI